MDLLKISGEEHGKLAVPIAVVSVSFASIFVKLSESNPLTISLYRLLFSTLILLPLTPKFLSQFQSMSRREIVMLVSAGIFLGGHMFLWVSSLEYTSVTSSVVLVTSHPLVVTWVSSKFLGEKAGRSVYLGILIALVGVIIMSVSDYRTEKWGLFGDILAILGMLAMAGYIIRGRQVRQKLHIIPYAFSVYGISTIFLFGFSLFSTSPIRIFPAEEYLLFFALAIIPTIFGHTIYNWALKFVEAKIVSISLLGEPIGAGLLAFIILNEIPPSLTVIGGAITLLGIFISIKWN
ncbi:MAG: DMT family transporter [Candidatus Hadarchaeia archaeon]